MKHYMMKLECGCEAVWWEADLFPGVGGMAECSEHGTQEIVEAWIIND